MSVAIGLLIALGFAVCALGTPAEMPPLVPDPKAFVCPNTDPTALLTSAAEYVCPDGTNGGFPLEWLATVN
ncbi:hypothetical protein KIPB_015531, partial [Kipferlia bialata]|eukprot:g15531.t1